MATVSPTRRQTCMYADKSMRKQRSHTMCKPAGSSSAQQTGRAHRPSLHRPRSSPRVQRRQSSHSIHLPPSYLAARIRRRARRRWHWVQELVRTRSNRRLRMRCHRRCRHRTHPRHQEKGSTPGCHPAQIPPAPFASMLLLRAIV